MLNRVVLVGRLTADPMLRYTPQGTPVSNFTLAVNRPFSNQQGERDADFISIVVWRRQAENAANFVKKGSLVGIDGRLQTRSYDNNEGNRVYITEVVADGVQFLEPKDGRGAGGATGESYQPTGQSNSRDNQERGQQDPFKDPFGEDPFRNDGTPIDIDDGLPF